MPIGTRHDGLDAGPRKSAPGTERFCAATGEVKPVDAMIRFVVGPDGAPVPDLKRRLPGRGIWITATRQALAAAIARKAFARGFRRDVRVAPDLVAATERLLEQAALDALAMSHKAGKVAVGFAKAETALVRTARLDCFRAGSMSGVPGMGKDRVPETAEAETRRDEMNHGGTPEN